jgi:hypothetical protein
LFLYVTGERERERERERGREKKRNKPVAEDEGRSGRSEKRKLGIYSIGSRKVCTYEQTNAPSISR